MPSIPASGEESDEKQSFSSKNNFSSRNASSKYDFVKELEFIHKSRSTVGYRQNVFSTTLSHLIATNSYHFLIPFIPIRGTLFLYHLSLHQNFQSQSNFFTERLKDKLEEFFNCQYKRFVEFTALISWRRGANIGWHSDDNRPYLKQRHFAVRILFSTTLIY
ncbi:hypothetical protein HN873_044033 [Arachis hypogaea]